AASGRLGEAPAARTAAVVAEYAARARRAGAERLSIVATSAVREAANGREFAAALEQATGEQVTVVSGEREAALTLAGVLAGVLAAIGGAGGGRLVGPAGTATTLAALDLGVAEYDPARVQ